MKRERITVKVSTLNLIVTFVHTRASILALGMRFGPILAHQRRLLWLPKVAIWTIFEFLSRPMIYSSHQMKPSTRIKPYRHLWVYTEKGSSAWTEVWSGTWPSRASIMAPGGRDLADF